MAADAHDVLRCLWIMMMQRARYSGAADGDVRCWQGVPSACPIVVNLKPQTMRQKSLLAQRSAKDLDGCLQLTRTPRCRHLMAPPLRN